MNQVSFLAAGENLQSGLLLGLLVVGAIVALVVIGVFARFGMLWLQAFMSGADVSMMSLIGMSFRQVNAQTIVTAQIMSRQSNLKLDKGKGLSTARLEAHYLAGGDVMHVMRAIIAANRAGIDLDFDRAAAIELAGRDVLDAVQTSVSPKVIDCPNPQRSGKTTLGAVARNGVELRVRARVTVRTNLDQLIGGATEETIVARIGQGIIAAIGSADSHMEVMETPDRISKGVLARGLDANTAFEIVSIDICDVDVGDNIGARLQSDQAEADMRMAKAHAEERRAVAVAHIQEMRAKVAENQSLVVQGEALVPAAMATAFRAGFLQVKKIPRPVRGVKPGSADLAS
ncbi:flotillin-like protein FloA [Lignipirellula cremea]|uniref:Flotillin-like protein FloA n=1 Tax=Lignipirellula cremea TaxID=2528010 RepID=A0A518DN77_9BACT|nr:flotillin-like protein FloA [Lignipirellula cremea]QDU93290.1 SigmaW regulon antibacterial [Lignipirellula cremea]